MPTFQVGDQVVITRPLPGSRHTAGETGTVAHTSHDARGQLVGILKRDGRVGIVRGDELDRATTSRQPLDRV